MHLETTSHWEEQMKFSFSFEFGWRQEVKKWISTAYDKRTDSTAQLVRPEHQEEVKAEGHIMFNQFPRARKVEMSHAVTSLDNWEIISTFIHFSVIKAVVLKGLLAKHYVGTDDWPEA